MNRRIAAMTLLGLLLASTSSGCMYLPFLDKAPSCCGFKGRAVDSVSGQPLSKVKLSVLAHKTRTSADGYFDIPPEYEWYWRWANGGPPPFTLQLQRGVNVEIVAEGYLPYRIWVPSRNAAETQPAGTVCYSDDYLLLNDVRLQPIQTQHAR